MVASYLLAEQTQTDIIILHIHTINIGAPGFLKNVGLKLQIVLNITVMSGFNSLTLPRDKESK